MAASAPSRRPTFTRGAARRSTPPSTTAAGATARASGRRSAACRSAPGRLAELALGAALTQEIPPLVELHLERGEAMRLVGRDLAHQMLDVREYRYILVGLAHRDGSLAASGSIPASQPPPTAL